ncbi:MAG TPA: nucleotide sugar dehydrogenase [Acidimicrobiia bacterium]|nr:nucleotide sugar dehydrogenase [Acidimicrobiia bacterium]
MEPDLRRPRLVVVGQGHAGLPLAVAAAAAGYDVVGYDVDAARIARLRAGESFVEDVPAAALEAALSGGHYLPSADPDDCSGFEVAVIAVPTPLRDRTPDLSHIEAAARLIAGHVRPGVTVILESTTYPGTTEELLAPALSEGSGLLAGVDFHLGYSPERVDPGNRRWTFARIPKLVSGVNDTSLAAVRAFYDGLVDETVSVSGTREAELAKLLENTFRQVNIALVNELAMFAADLRIDLWEAIDAASTKPFGFMRFSPGPGVGGHCLPIDPSYLSWRVEQRLGSTFRFVELANEINHRMPEYVVRRVVAALERRHIPAGGCRVLLLGLAYKPNSGDARGSQGAAIARLLTALGAEVRVCDPHVPASDVPAGIERVEPTARELSAADAVLLVTDHDAFDLDAIQAGAAFVFDTRHRVRGANVEHL